MKKLVFMIACITTAANCGASVYLVPQEYPTIQSAVDAAENADSVLVSPGVYAEEVSIGRFLVLKGHVERDTGDYPRPVLDPSALSNPGTRTCLTISSDSVIVADFVFHNGPEMYPRESGYGGVFVVSGTACFEYCRFDSTYYGIRSPNRPVIVRHCEFLDAQMACIQVNSAALVADNCVFTGWVPSGFALIRCGANSVLEHCRTHDMTGEGDLWWLSGYNVRVDDCVFGPTTTGVGSAVWGISLQSSLFERNLFTGMVVGGALINCYNCSCDSPVVVRNNCFLDNYGREDGGQGGNNVYVGCPDDDSCASYVAENNLFLGGTQIAGDKALSVGLGDVVRRNRFLRMNPGGLPVLQGERLGGECSENIFIRNGLACSADSSVGATLNASLNYWGHATGPHHPALNPAGRGDDVTDHVEFLPWYPDTSFLETPMRTMPGVASAALQAYPNPFNATATLKFEIPEPGIFRIELFDVLGRRVKELFVGPVAYEKVVRFDGSELASGIYYARAWQTTHNRPVATAKLVLLR